MQLELIILFAAYLQRLNLFLRSKGLHLTGKPSIGLKKKHTISISNALYSNIREREAF